MKEERFIFEKTSFGYTNPEAEIVLVGITPGNSQLINDREGKSLKEIKRENAFAGNMRPNLVAMLDYIGINKMLGISTCKTLWEEDFDKVEMTSLLKDATYEINSKGEKTMFKDTRKIPKSKKLTEMFANGFFADCQNYNNTKLFIACGPGVYEVLQALKEQNIIKAPIVGIAHPSGANAGRISCFLGKKEPNDASYQWCRDKAEEAKEMVKAISLN